MLIKLSGKYVEEDGISYIQLSNGMAYEVVRAFRNPYLESYWVYDSSNFGYQGALYAFESLSDRSFFLAAKRVKGVSKALAALLSRFSVEEISELYADGKIDVLLETKGLGKKKLAALQKLFPKPKKPSEKKTDLPKEYVDSLQFLKFSRDEIEKGTTEEILKLALKDSAEAVKLFLKNRTK